MVVGSTDFTITNAKAVGCFLTWTQLSLPLYLACTPFPEHISTVRRGDACLATCLRCGFIAAGANLPLLERVVQDHKCKAERHPPERIVLADPTRKAAS